jgi:hypothetical protein
MHGILGAMKKRLGGRPEEPERCVVVEHVDAAVQNVKISKTAAMPPPVK